MQLRNSTEANANVMNEDTYGRDAAFESVKRNIGAQRARRLRAQGPDGLKLIGAHVSMGQKSRDQQSLPLGTSMVFNSPRQQLIAQNSQIRAENNTTSRPQLQENIKGSVRVLKAEGATLNISLDFKGVTTQNVRSSVPNLPSIGPVSMLPSQTPKSRPHLQTIDVSLPMAPQEPLNRGSQTSRRAELIEIQKQNNFATLGKKTQRLGSVSSAVLLDLEKRSDESLPSSNGNDQGSSLSPVRMQLPIQYRKETVKESVKREVAQTSAKKAGKNAEEVLDLPSIVNPVTGLEPAPVFQKSLPERLKEKKRLDNLKNDATSNKDLQSVITKIHNTTHIPSSKSVSSVGESLCKKYDKDVEEATSRESIRQNFKLDDDEVKEYQAPVDKYDPTEADITSEKMKETIARAFQPKAEQEEVLEVQKQQSEAKASEKSEKLDDIDEFTLNDLEDNLNPNLITMAKKIDNNELTTMTDFKTAFGKKASESTAGANQSNRGDGDFTKWATMSDAASETASENSFVKKNPTDPTKNLNQTIALDKKEIIMDNLRKVLDENEGPSAPEITAKLKAAAELKLNSNNASHAWRQLKEQTELFKPYSFNDFNKFVDQLIYSVKPRDITPLLRSYDQLFNNTKMQLPKKTLLQYDQKCFLEFVKKLRKAQDLELAYVRKMCAQKAKDLIKDETTYLRNVMQEEFQMLFYQLAYQRDQLLESNRKNEELVSRLAQQETMLIEMRAYVQDIDRNLMQDYYDLTEIDMGTYVCPEEGIDDLTGVAIKPKLLPNGKCQCPIKESIRIQNAYLEDLRRKEVTTIAEDIVQHKVKKQEPLMSNVFNFYGSRVQLTRAEKLGVAKNTLFGAYRGMMQTQKEHFDALDQKQKAQYTQLCKFKIEAEQTRAENLKLLERIDELADNTVVDEVNEYIETIAVQKKDIAALEERLKKCKETFTEEVKVQEQIIARVIQENVTKTDQLRHFAFLLKVPRLHHEYLSKYGIDDFIKTVSHIAKENQALKGHLLGMQESESRRKAQAFIKHLAGNYNQKVSHKRGAELNTLIPSTSQALINQLKEAGMTEDTPWLGNFKKQVEAIFSVNTKAADELIAQRKEIEKGQFTGRDFPLHAVSTEVQKEMMLNQASSMNLLKNHVPQSQSLNIEEILNQRSNEPSPVRQSTQKKTVPLEQNKSGAPPSGSSQTASMITEKLLNQTGSRFNKILKMTSSNNMFDKEPKITIKTDKQELNLTGNINSPKSNRENSKTQTIGDNQSMMLRTLKSLLPSTNSKKENNKAIDIITEANRTDLYQRYQMTDERETKSVKDPIAVAASGGAEGYSFEIPQKVLESVQDVLALSGNKEFQKHKEEKLKEENKEQIATVRKASPIYSQSAAYFERHTGNILNSDLAAVPQSQESSCDSQDSEVPEDQLERKIKPIPIIVKNHKQAQENSQQDLTEIAQNKKSFTQIKQKILSVDSQRNEIQASVSPSPSQAQLMLQSFGGNQNHQDFLKSLKMIGPQTKNGVERQREKRQNKIMLSRSISCEPSQDFWAPQSNILGGGQSEIGHKRKLKNVNLVGNFYKYLGNQEVGAHLLDTTPNFSLGKSIGNFPSDFSNHKSNPNTMNQKFAFGYSTQQSKDQF